MTKTNKFEHLLKTSQGKYKPIRMFIFNVCVSSHLIKCNKTPMVNFIIRLKEQVTRQKWWSGSWSIFFLFSRNVEYFWKYKTDVMLEKTVILALSTFEKFE